MMRKAQARLKKGLSQTFMI